MAKNKIFVDGDLLCFPSAAASEDRIYIAKDLYGNTVAEFTSAASYQTWLNEIEIFGTDMQHGFNGSVEELTREFIIRPKKLSHAKRHFEQTLEEWLSACPTGDVTVYLAPKSGQRNPRHDIALRKPYKGNRKDAHKPYFLQELREWALKLPYTKRATAFETDDLVAGFSQRAGENGYQIQNEKDGLNSVGCWVYYPDVHLEPVFSDPTTIGYIEGDSKKVTGLGHLHLLYQVIAGDAPDNYAGLDGAGKKKALDVLTPFNNAPVEMLEEVIKEVAILYKTKYGYGFEYKNKEGVPSTASWYDFYEESVRLAYMLKHRKDFPNLYLDAAKGLL